MSKALGCRMAIDYRTAELTVMFDDQFFSPNRLFCGEGMDLHKVIRDFLVPEIILTVMVADCTEYPAGIAHGQNAGGQILGHDAPGTHNSIIANGYAGHDQD